MKGMLIIMYTTKNAPFYLISSQISIYIENFIIFLLLPKKKNTKERRNEEFEV